jgi:hypothetical protein
MRKFQKSFQPALFCFAEGFDAFSFVSAADHCADGKHNDVDQFVPLVIFPRIIRSLK